ncbi:MAG: nuclear transport factor 2 family protein [Rhodospirillaceae bacterium]|nr:nuclear transport factor 2 family protein [Rhodospirillaceae bacterium]
MKRVIAPLLAALAMAAWPGDAAQALDKRGGTDAEYAEIQAIADNWFAAYGKGDAATVADIYDPAARVMSEGDAAYVGNAGLKERLEKSFAVTRTTFFHEIEEIEVAGNLAYLVGLYAARNAPKTGGEAKVYGGRFFIVLRRTDRGWKVWRDIDNFTPDADALIAKAKAAP